MPTQPGATRALYQIPLQAGRAIDLLVLHCAATRSGAWLNGDGRGPQTAPGIIDRWHAARGFIRGTEARNRFNWHLPHVGYHFVVDLDGYVWTGRHVDEIGAHVLGHNERSIGICLVGGAEREARYTAEQWRALADLVARLLPLSQSGRIVGHRDLLPAPPAKTCPGFDVRAWVANGFKPAPVQVCPTPHATDARLVTRSGARAPEGEAP